MNRRHPLAQDPNAPAPAEANPGRQIRVFLLLMALLFGGSLFASVGPGLYNQWTLSNFAGPFLDYPLPPDTEQINEIVTYGFFALSGPGCNFRAERVLRTTLSEDDLRAYYRGVGFSPVEAGSDYALLDGSLIPAYVDFKEGFDGLVTVSIFDGGYQGFRAWDRRCRP